MYELIVVGGGVAGLMAAGTAASHTSKPRVLLLEKMEKPARKLRITGKGRCNLTNDKPKAEFLEKIRQGKTFFEPSFDQFDNKQAIRFVQQELGVPLTVERGSRVFPTSGKAWDIADALVRWVRDCGVEIRCTAPVESLWIEDNTIRGVLLHKRDGEEQKTEGKRVLLATGGVSYPSTGSTGDGHRMAMDAAGHEIVGLRPALVPLEVNVPTGLKGLHLRNIALTLLVDGQVSARRFGEVEFTDDRILGGAATLQVSREAVDAVLDGKQVELSIDLKPALTKEQLKRRITREREQAGPERSILRKLLPGELVRVIQSEDQELVETLKAWRIGVSDYRPFTEAIVTAGGIKLDELNPASMESCKIKGLYFAGELLDIDADTGGYNIQVALSTGYAAGKSAVR